MLVSVVKLRDTRELRQHLRPALTRRTAAVVIGEGSGVKSKSLHRGYQACTKCNAIMAHDNSVWRVLCTCRPRRCKSERRRLRRRCATFSDVLFLFSISTKCFTMHFHAKTVFCNEDYVNTHCFVRRTLIRCAVAKPDYQIGRKFP